jgi:NAD(P)-dependent dehydrogenase (short-subunit alcohol dehydrogenase family)
MADMAEQAAMGSGANNTARYSSETALPGRSHHRPGPPGPPAPSRPHGEPSPPISISSTTEDVEYMTDKKVWLITGAGRGMGVDIAKAALAAGNAVVAAGRNTETVAKAVGPADDLLVVKLDITSREDTRAAVQSAVDRFGRIDVLVNNAATAQMGYFEEISPEAFERQLATNLLGPINVTRAVLPVMRTQRSGLIVTISSTAGLTGMEFTSAYATSKFGLEGWMESLAPEVAPFGIHTTIVEPGFFRTELLEKASVSYGDLSLDDYAERTAETQAWWEAQNGQQGGDPAKLGRALVTIASQEPPPRRFMAGADSIALAEQKAMDLQEQINAFRDLSTSLAIEGA